MQLYIAANVENNSTQSNKSTTNTQIAVIAINVEKNSTNVDESYFVTNVENKLDEKVTL
jgi:hypothetical protein